MCYSYTQNNDRITVTRAVRAVSGHHMNRILNSKQFKTLLPIFLLGVALIAAYKLINHIDVVFGFFSLIWNIVRPFMIGFVVAYILSLPFGAIMNLLGKIRFRFMEKAKKPLAVTLTYLLLALLIFLILNLIIPAIYENVSFFVENFQTYYQGAIQLIEYVNDIEFFDFDISMELIMGWIRDFSMEHLATSFRAVFGVYSFIFNIFLATVSSIYILFEKDKFRVYFDKFMQIYLSERVYAAIMKYFGKLNKNFKQYIYTQTLDGVILGTIATIELYILRSPYALMLGIMLGVVNYIPYFGSIIGSIVVVIVVAFTQNITMALITAAVLLITQQIDGNVIQPKLMGSAMRLSPLLVIIAITVGGAFAGIFGMIAAIPIIAVLKDILDDFTAYVEQKKALEKV